jgi:hypothetical protein
MVNMKVQINLSHAKFMISHFEVNSKLWNFRCDVFLCALNSLGVPNVNPGMKQWEKKIGACSLTCNTLGVGRCVGALGWD